MQSRSNQLAVLAVAMCVACGAATSTPAQPPPSPAAPDQHHHELHLPPVGPSVSVTLDGRKADVVLATVPHEGTTATLLALWKLAFPSEDAAPLHFDLTGSDGFHPASRPPCQRLLTGAEIAAARIDVVTHNVSFEGLDLPGCYRVKAVVNLDATR